MEIREALVATLAEAGVDTVFGIPGGITLPLNHAIDEREDVRFVMAHHETAVTHQAWGYAESSGRMAATLVVPGPGDMNALNGLQNALNDCNPLVHISVEGAPETRGGDGIHEAPPTVYDDVVKENITVQTPASAVPELRRAIAVAQTPPKGPVRLGIPTTFLERDARTVGGSDFARDPTTEIPDGEVRDAAALLAGATAPILIAGGGVRAANATAELEAVAEQLDAPVVTTRKGKGTFPEDHDLFAGVLTVAGSRALAETIASSDAALGVGTDLDAFTTQGWAYEVPERLVHVTLHNADLGVGYEPAVGIVADAKRTLDAIGTELRTQSIRSEGGTERARAVREAERERVADLRERAEPPLTSLAALDALRRAVPRSAILSIDASGCGLWADACIPAYDPTRYLNQGSWATMGTAVPAAIGAKLANPEDAVVALCGDGGLLMAIHELHTAVSEGIPIVTVVFNNDDFAIISDRATRRYQMDRFDWQQSSISFATVAAGMGMNAERAETPGEIESTLEAALEADEPTLVEVPTDPNEPQVGNRFVTF
ncbi:MAG: thiamine pyrophosphate-binding protein [Halobacteriota archaeon]